MFTLNKAHAFYGSSVYDIKGLEQFGLKEIKGESDLDLETLGRALQHTVGGLSSEAYRDRINKITHVKADDRFGIPELIVVDGDGFQISWKKV